MLGKEKVREIARKYSREVAKVLNPVSVVLFGSYVNGVPHEWSDIDLAVLVDNIDEKDWYNSRILLQKIRWYEDDFDDIEPHLLDLNNDPSGFARHVYNTGQIIYQGEPT